MWRASVWRSLWIMALVLGVGPNALAQRPTPLPPTGSGSPSGSSGRTGDAQREIEADTFGLFYFTLANINEDEPFTDTLLTDFQQYDPTRLPTVDYSNLGILGSAHQPLLYEPYEKSGFRIGIDPFPLYRKTGNNLRYFRQERPYTDLRFVQGTEQADTYLTTKFSRNFANGINFSLDYGRLSQVGDRDQYPNQHLRNTNVALGLWYHATNGRYDGFLSFAANTYEQEQNGGLRTLPVLTGEFDTPSSAEVFLEDARTRQSNREYMYTHFYRLGGRRDSTGNYSRAFTLSHQIALNNAAYKTWDPFTAADTTFYQRFPELQVDIRGNRHFLRHQSVENSFRIATFRRDRAVVRAAARRQRDLLEVGVTHRYNFVQGEPLDSVVNNLMLTGRTGFRLGEGLNLDVQGQLNLLRQAGDYRVQGNLFVDLGVAGEMQVQATTQRYAPSLLENRFWLSGTEIWRNFFERTLEQSLSATYVLPVVKIAVTGRYHLINNYIYADTTGVMQQSASPVNILQFMARRNLRFGVFQLNNTVVYQATTEPVVAIPSLYGKHSLFFDGRLFKVLNVQMGFDVRYLSRYFPYYFNPITNQFQLQQRQETPFYANVDAFFSMRLRQFRAFVKLENMTTMIGEKQLFYLTAEYPYPDSALRFGIRWRMID